MKTLEGLQQGSDQWLAVRRQHLCASEAAAMMGFDKRTSRTELLRMKATGAEREFSEWTQKNLLDKGHEIEAAARGIAEKIIGDDTYPVIGVLEVEGLPLLASFDGIVMDESTIWECKSRNAALLAAVEGGDLPDSHWPQVEQQLLISGADKALFTPTDGTEAGTVEFWYESKPDRRQQLIASWQQFQIDLAGYQYVERIPEAVAAPIDDLPALTVELVGQVKNSNLISFQTTVLARIQAINTDLKTDDDFATADKMVTFLDNGEKRLDLVKAQALSQTASIDELFRAIDSLKGEMRAKRLTLNNLVKSRKEAIRGEIVAAGRAALAGHILDLNKRLGRPYMPAIPENFAGVIKGKKTIASLRDACDTELARLKIEANAIADRIGLNLNTLQELASDHKFLFADESQIVLKANDDLTALVKLRIADHKAAEQKRLDQEREKIRAEEQAKLACEEEARKAKETAAAQVSSCKDRDETGSAANPATAAAPSDAIWIGPDLRTTETRSLIDKALSTMSLAELGEALDAIRAIRSKRPSPQEST